MFAKKSFLIALSLFIFLNIFFYSFLFFFNTSVPFNSEIYSTQSHHYFSDPRIHNQPFELLRGIGAWDAQWYLRIADDGYPTNLNHYMGALTYAFFPLYPVLLAFGDLGVHNIELTAFLITIMLLLANFFSLYYVGTKLYSSSIALRATFLLYLYPFSLFFRSYYTEGIFLLLLLWFSYFLIKKRWFLTTLLMSLLFVTRPNGPFMGIIFLFFLYKGVRKKEISVIRAVSYTILSSVLFFGWLYFCYLQTGKPFYWHEVQSVWYHSTTILTPLLHNLSTILSFFILPLHTARESKVDVIVIVIVLLLLIKSKKWLKPELWWISLLIFIVPLLLKDTMSYSRFQSVSFPLFFYLGYMVKGWRFGVISAIFAVLLFIAGLIFVNWYWVG